MKEELVPVTNYLPDVVLIKKNRVEVVMAVGEWGQERKKWYVEVARILLAEFGCELVTFPGHHGSYMDMPNEFADRPHSVLQKVDR
jgi:hypothetical protein